MIDSSLPPAPSRKREGEFVVAVVGRANVGKSLLFNRLTGAASAIVHERPGMTLDVVSGKLRGGGAVLLDTAGIFGEDVGSAFAALAKQQTENAIKQAHAALLVVDARDGLQPADKDLLNLLRRRGMPRLFAVNKSEGLPAPCGDFHSLGEKEMFAVSAKRGDGCAQLSAAIDALFRHGACPRVGGGVGGNPAIIGGTNWLDSCLRRNDEGVGDGEGGDGDDGDDVVTVAVIGRPNVGKSTFVNCVLGYERMIVSDIAGTTRDSVRCQYQAPGGGEFILTDTAGLRRRRADNAREKLSVSAARQTVARAEVGLLMVDIAAGATHQDKRIAALMAKSTCAMVILANKADTVAKKERKQLLAKISADLPLTSEAEAFAISAQCGDMPLAKILRAARAAAAGGRLKLSSAKLTRMLAKITTTLPPPRAGCGRPKLRYAHQGGRFSIVVHGSGADKIGGDYRRYLASSFCRELKLRGAPLKILFRSEHK